MKTSKLIMLTTVVLIFASCSKNNPIEPPQEQTSIVYVAGIEKNGPNYVATLWKDGEIIRLADANTSSEARSVFVSGTDVYVGGTEHNGSAFIARIWKNGDPISLTNDNVDAYVLSVFVDGPDVYAAGYMNDGQKRIAVLWKNGTTYETYPGLKESRAYSVCVSNGNVYVAGYIRNALNKNIAILWENGVALTLSNTAYNAEAYSVCAASNKVYVVGYKEMGMGSKLVASMWTVNDAFSIQDNLLSDGLTDAKAHSVYVKGNDVYVGGYQFIGAKNRARLWKNGNPVSLPSDQTNEYSFAENVYVHANDVYIAGYGSTNGSNNVAKLWKNGELSDLAPTSVFSIGYSVFVK